jgi:IS5 family transposase
MHQAKKGNQLRFRIKAHIGVDAGSGLVHTVIGTPANVNDVTQGHGLLHGEEALIFADAGYQVADKRLEATGVQWHIALRPGKRRVQDKQSPWGLCWSRPRRSKRACALRWSIPFG